MGEVMGTQTEVTGGGRGGFQGNPQAVYTNPSQQDYNRAHNQMTYPIFQPTQSVQNNNQGAYQAQVFGQNQNPGITRGQGGHGVAPQPVYQLTVQQPGTVPQGEQGSQGGQRNQGPQGAQGVQEAGAQQEDGGKHARDTVEVDHEPCRRPSPWL